MFWLTSVKMKSLGLVTPLMSNFALLKSWTDPIKLTLKSYTVLSDKSFNDTSLFVASGPFNVAVFTMVCKLALAPLLPLTSIS